MHWMVLNKCSLFQSGPRSIYHWGSQLRASSPVSTGSIGLQQPHAEDIFFFYFNIFFFPRFPPSPSPSPSSFPPRRHLLSGPQGSQALVEDLSFEEVQRRLELHGHF